MREIRFRAWDENRKAMHKDFQFIKSGDARNDWIIPIKPLSDDNWVRSLSEDSLRSAPHCRQQFHLMQFTGLLDKNGTEIYEGDVITWGFGHSVVEMKTITDDGDKFMTGWVGDDSFVDSACEVIGNIHENPDLLKPEGQGG